MGARFALGSPEFKSSASLVNSQLVRLLPVSFRVVFVNSMVDTILVWILKATVMAQTSIEKNLIGPGGGPPHKKIITGIVVRAFRGKQFVDWSALGVKTTTFKDVIVSLDGYSRNQTKKLMRRSIYSS